LKKRGEILHYDSPEYKAYPKTYTDQGYWAATGLSSIIILVNTRRVSADNVPKSWWDLTKPFWRNKLTIDNLEVSGTGYDWLVEIVNEPKLGWKFIEELGKNKLSLERGHAGMAQKVAAGEYFGAVEMSDFHLQGLRNASATVPLPGSGQALSRFSALAGGPDALRPRDGLDLGTPGRRQCRLQGDAERHQDA
jgi:ABC-type Fe3+ transport system substrate-binding protein